MLCACHLGGAELCNHRHLSMRAAALIQLIRQEALAGGIKVESRILAGSPARLTEIKNTLGSDAAKLLTKNNKELVAQVRDRKTSPTASKDSRPIFTINRFEVLHSSYHQC